MPGAWPSTTVTFALVAALLAQEPAGRDGPGAGDPKADRARREFLRDLYLADASSYTIYRDAGRKEKAELRREPAYVWTNPTRNGGQDGHVFVWTCRGPAPLRQRPRPVAPALRG